MSRAHSARVLTGRRELQCPQAARRCVHHRSEGRVSESGDGLCPARRRTGWLTSQQRWPRGLANSRLHHSLSKLCFGPLRTPTSQPTSYVAMPCESGSQVAQGPTHNLVPLLQDFSEPSENQELGGSSGEGCHAQPFPSAFTHRPRPISETSLWNDSRLSGSCRNSPERFEVSLILFPVAVICQTPRLPETAFKDYVLLSTKGISQLLQET